jgi:hypothetical protein
LQGRWPLIFLAHTPVLRGSRDRVWRACFGWAWE